MLRAKILVAPRILLVDDLIDGKSVDFESSLDRSRSQYENEDVVRKMEGRLQIVKIERNNATHV